jgi:hypothetical protein
LAPGASPRGVSIGIVIAQRAKALTGRATSFGVALTGPYGAVEWISLFDTVQDLQNANEALAADASFAQFIDKEAANLYQESATIQTAYRRLA